MAEKSVSNHHGDFLFERKSEIQIFDCARCGGSKKSKIAVQWTDKDHAVKTICNGCYGYLLAN